MTSRWRRIIWETNSRLFAHFSLPDWPRGAALAGACCLRQWLPSVDLEDELATLFGRPVDLVARKAISFLLGWRRVESLSRNNNGPAFQVEGRAIECLCD